MYLEEEVKLCFLIGLFPLGCLSLQARRRWRVVKLIW